MKILNWCYVYVLQSLKDKGFYIGYTTNPTERIKQHNAKMNLSTKSRTPFEYIYMEACKNEMDAKRREMYLKTTQGGRFLKIRLRDFMAEKLEK